jgi:hypothetical protein
VHLFVPAENMNEVEPGRKFIFQPLQLFKKNIELRLRLPYTNVKEDRGSIINVVLIIETTE